MAFFSKSLLTLSAAAVSVSLALFQPVMALDDIQKKEIVDFIKEYLVQHPEALVEAQDAYQAQQTSKKFTDNAKTIFNADYDVTIGNPKGDVTIVEFFDYNCGYCRGSLPDTDKLLKTDKNIRYVLKEFPILGPDSVAASKVSDAFRKLAPEKYAEFSHTILASTTKASEESAIELAGTMGITEDAIRKEMAASPNEATVKETYQLATDLGVTGTPAYVIGNEAISGAIGLDALTEKVANMRACGKTAC